MSDGSLVLLRTRHLSAHLRAHDSDAGPKRQVAPLDDIVELRAERRRGAECPALRLKDGTSAPLTPYDHTGDDHPEVESAVNDWLAGKA